MNPGWREWRVEALAERVAMGPFGSSIRVDTFVPEGIPVISGRHLTGTRLVEDEFNYVTVEHADRLKNSNAYRGDVVFTHAGNIGQVAVIPETSRFPRYVMSQRQFKLTPRADVADPRFLAYYFAAPTGRHQLLANASFTGVPSIARPVTYLRSLKINLPPIEEQRAIASVLGALDDKIELNRRMNETLEALARAIFTSWFVDFDPVRARAAGRQPVGMDAETAALFPDSFEDSPLGPIPSGWEAVRLGSQIDIVRGLSYSGAGLTDAGGGGMPLHNLNSIYEGGGYKHDGLKWYVGEYQERHVVRPGDVIVANTEQGFHELLIGYPALIPRRYGKKSLYSADLFRIDPRVNSPLTRPYLSLLFAVRRYHEEIAGYSNGTTINHLPTVGLERPWIALPPAPIGQRFDQIVAPMLETQEMNHAGSESLGQLRDALLPRLISGEIRTPAA